MIKCIIFDLGGVVLTNDWSRKYKDLNSELCNYFSISEADLVRAWDKHWPDFKIGAYSEDEFWKKFLIETGTKKIDVKKCKELWRKYQHPINDLFGLIKTLKKKYKIVALANIGSEWLDFKMQKFKLGNYFDKIIGSGKYGFAKPDKRIYLITLKEISIKPEECIYIDDKSAGLMPAKQLGIKTILFKSKDQLIKEFNEHNIEVD